MGREEKGRGGKKTAGEREGKRREEKGEVKRKTLLTIILSMITKWFT